MHIAILTVLSYIIMVVIIDVDIVIFIIILN